jgi:hypothetical protein
MTFLGLKSALSVQRNHLRSKLPTTIEALSKNLIIDICSVSRLALRFLTVIST